jgi:hypothetical protein
MKDVMKRAYEIIMGHPPVNAKLLYAQLAVDFVHLTGEDIHAAISLMVEKKIVIELKYQMLHEKGSLFFPPETSFEYVSKR